METSKRPEEEIAELLVSSYHECRQKKAKWLARQARLAIRPTVFCHKEGEPESLARSGVKGLVLLE